MTRKSTCAERRAIAAQRDRRHWSYPPVGAVVRLHFVRWGDENGQERTVATSVPGLTARLAAALRQNGQAVTSGESTTAHMPETPLGEIYAALHAARPTPPATLAAIARVAGARRAAA